MTWDPQRQQAYRWAFSLPELRADVLFDSLPKLMKFSRCEAFVWRVWADWIPSYAGPPAVAGGEGGDRTALALGGREQIILPLWARTRFVALHELAHAIQDYHSMDHTFEWHGPVWARLFLDLVERYAQVDASRALMLATQHGVVVAPKRSRIHPLGRIRQ